MIFFLCFSNSRNICNDNFEGALENLKKFKTPTDELTEVTEMLESKIKKENQARDLISAQTTNDSDE